MGVGLLGPSWQLFPQLKSDAIPVSPVELTSVHELSLAFHNTKTHSLPLCLVSCH